MREFHRTDRKKEDKRISCEDFALIFFTSDFFKKVHQFFFGF